MLLAEPIEQKINRINEIASDPHLNPIEKKVRIAEYLSGIYSGRNGTIRVYRSPDNRTLLAIKGTFQGSHIHQINLRSDKVLTAIQNI